MRFENRQTAGRQLAARLNSLKRSGNLDLSDAVVIALPRGGVPVGFEIAHELGLALDVCVVRKVGAPSQPELAVAAVTEGDEIFINQEICRSLGLSAEQISQLAQPKYAEVRARAMAFRPHRAAIDIKNKTIVLVDDGLATGATALSAIHLLKKKKTRKVVLALPVCPASAIIKLKPEVDLLEVLLMPEEFYAVGQWYVDFSQVSDEQVKALLQRATEFSLQGG